MMSPTSDHQQPETPLVRRLIGAMSRRFHRRRLRFVKQTTTMDCGAACLAMVLDWHGHPTTQEEIRRLITAGRDGSSALGIIKAAKQLGLRGRGAAIDLDDLQYLEPGAILHWGFDHFVVFDRLTNNGARIVDPAIGGRTVARRELDKKFTGVAIVFEPSGSTQQAAPQKNQTWSFAKNVLLRSRFLGRVLCITLLAQVLGLTLPIMTGTLVDSIIPNGDVDIVTLFLIGSLGLAFFHFLLLFIRSHLLLFLRIDLDRQMTQDFMAHVLRLPLAFFHTRKSGDLLMRLNSNAAAREIITSSAISATFDGVMVVSYLVIVLAMNPTIGLVVATLGLLRVLVFWFSRLRLRSLMAEGLVNQAEANSYQIQMLEGIETLKAAGAEDRAYDRWAGLYIDVLNVAVRQGRLDALTHSLISSLGFVSPLIILGTGALMVMDGSLSLGAMLGLIALANGFLQPLASLVGVGFKFQQLGSLVQRIGDILDTTPDPVPESGITLGSFRGNIEVEGVGFRYPGAERDVLRDITFTVEPGIKLAICGRSGAGKSTLGHLLLGLYRPTSGAVYYDRIDLRRLDPESIHAQVGAAIQHNLLFHGTIRDNIALANPSLPLDDIEAAARLAHIHDEIVAMPMQYNTVVSGSGSTLSGGQVQRIAIARALANHPAMILLDEATSALDAQTEKSILDEIHGFPQTVITITHRISVLRRADIVLVMDQGRIVEAGKHADLAEQDGIYASLIRAAEER